MANTSSYPLVSLLTPCYNTGVIVHRLLDSVLMQTYPNLEMIVIDDGSSDNSAEVIKSYIDKFEEKGYSLKYVYQENSGQSVAIKEGLKMVKGEYLLWPDSDDYYRDADTIEVLVRTLQGLPEEYAMVRTWINFIGEDSLETIEVVGPGRPEANFEDCLYGRNFYFPPGHVIVKFNKLKEVSPLEIYTDKNAGQNWQLYLPILYHFKCKTIPEAKYNVLCRTDSHSRGHFNTCTKQIEKLKSYEATIVSTLEIIKGMPEVECAHYIKEIHQKYALERFDIATDNVESRYIKENKTQLDVLGYKLSGKRKLKYFLWRVGMLKAHYRFRKLLNRICI